MNRARIAIVLLLALAAGMAQAQLGRSQGQALEGVEYCHLRWNPSPVTGEHVAMGGCDTDGVTTITQLTGHPNDLNRVSVIFLFKDYTDRAATESMVRTMVRIAYNLMPAWAEAEQVLSARLRAAGGGDRATASLQINGNLVQLRFSPEESGSFLETLAFSVERVEPAVAVHVPPEVDDENKNAEAPVGKKEPTLELARSTSSQAQASGSAVAVQGHSTDGSPQEPQ